MPTFTARAESAIDEDVELDLDRILDAVHATGLPVRAVYLIGAFGRGEGTVRYDGVRWRAVNDYDIVVVTDLAESSRPAGLDGLAGRLAKELGIDFVDLWFVTPGELAGMTAPTIQNYDIKYGSRLLEGEDLLKALPEIAADQIPPFEFARLLANRSAGLLTARMSEHSSPQYAANQLVKACIAVGDTAVYLALGYHHSYRERLARFEALATSGDLMIARDAVQIDAVTQAFHKKISGPSAAPFHLPASLMRDLMSEAFRAAAERSTGRRVDSLASAEKALIAKFPGRNHQILFAQPAFSCLKHGRFSQGYAYLSRFRRIPGALRLPWSRGSAVRLWEQWCHA